MFEDEESHDGLFRRILDIAMESRIIAQSTAMLGFPVQGILPALLFMLREVVDMRGYLASLQGDAAISRALVEYRSGVTSCNDEKEKKNVQ